MSDTPRTHFIQDIINEHNASGQFGGKVITRFPPEPNGYLHIGHAKSICLNFGLALEYGGRCHMRFDDTNPTKEEVEYVESIMKDIRWLGFDWGEHLYYASDYIQQLYEWALLLIKGGKAYVCDLNAEQIREYRGTLTKPGKNSPDRDRGVEENLALFERMKNGEFPDGSRTLRAKIDMASPNLNMRDPVLFRILHAHHYRTGDQWCIYPMYDYAHGQGDWIEGVTHSICTLEFENHRPLYDWCLDTLIALGAKSPNPAVTYRPLQFEFARLNLTYTVMSKRRLLSLVKEGHVKSWDDPRMPTLAGFRRRGYTPEAIREFCKRIGVAKFYSVVDIQVLEGCLREDLNKRAPRVMGVLRPLKVVIDNYPEAQTEQLDAINNPEDESAGTRKVPFSKVLYIERDDFREDPPKQFFRLAPGREVRLRYAYFIKCERVVKDAAGNITELHCTYDPATRGGDAPDGRKVKATLHWVSAQHAIPCEVRLYDHLFTKPDPDDVSDTPTRCDTGVSPVPASGSEAPHRARSASEGLAGGSTPTVDHSASRKPQAPAPIDAVDADEIEESAEEAATASAGPGWRDNLNPKSLELIPAAMLEPSIAGSPVGTTCQFERHGYFCVDPDTTNNKLVFNRTVTLKDTWAKIEKKGRG